MNFGDLRSILQNPPSEKLFQTLCKKIAFANKELITDEMLVYLQSHLNKWPEDIPRNCKFLSKMGKDREAILLSNAIVIKDKDDLERFLGFEEVHENITCLKFEWSYREPEGSEHELENLVTQGCLEKTFPNVKAAYIINDYGGEQCDGIEHCLRLVATSYPSLSSLTTSNVDAATIDKFLRAKHCLSLKHLDIAFAGPRDELPCEPISHYSSLEVLNIRGFSLRDQDSLLELKNLQETTIEWYDELAAKLTGEDILAVEKKLGRSTLSKRTLNPNLLSTADEGIDKLESLGLKIKDRRSFKMKYMDQVARRADTVIHTRQNHHLEWDDSISESFGEMFYNILASSEIRNIEDFFNEWRSLDFHETHKDALLSWGGINVAPDDCIWEGEESPAFLASHEALIDYCDQWFSDEGFGYKQEESHPTAPCKLHYNCTVSLSLLVEDVKIEVITGGHRGISSGNSLSFALYDRETDDVIIALDIEPFIFIKELFMNILAHKYSNCASGNIDHPKALARVRFATEDCISTTLHYGVTSHKTEPIEV